MPFPTAGDDARAARWWLSDETVVSRDLAAYARHIQSSPAFLNRLERLRRNARLYANVEMLGLRPWEFSRVPITVGGAARVTFNLIASCAQTAAAKLGANRPAPQFLTDGADWEMRRKADKLNKFGRGVLYQSGAYQRGVACFIDACVFDIGAMKVYGDSDRGVLVAERVMPWDILVEDADGYYGAPRCVVQRSYVDRQVLIEQWGKDEPTRAAITAAKAIESSAGTSSDLVEVHEGWHLRSGPKAKDGRHVLGIEGCAFLDEPWTRDRFPIAFFRWEEAIAGFYGRGMADRIVGTQFEINILCRKVTESMRQMGRTFIVVDAMSGIPKSHIDNSIGAVYVAAPGGHAPQVIAPQSVHPEIFEQINILIQRGYQELGMSELSTQSQKPAGLDSKVALQEFNDIESERFMHVGRAWEQFYMDIVHIGLDEAREMKNLEIDVPDKNQRTTVRWADVQLDRQAYVLQCFPISSLPSTPAGRLEKVTDMIDSGLLSREEGLEKLDMPDLDEAMEMALAPRKAIRARIDAMLDHGERALPEPDDDLATAIDMTTRVIKIEQVRGCPEARLDLLRAFRDAAIQMMPKPAAPAPMPGAPVPQPATQPAPMPAPMAA